MTALIVQLELVDKKDFGDDQRGCCASGRPRFQG